MIYPTVELHRVTGVEDTELPENNQPRFVVRVADLPVGWVDPFSAESAFLLMLTEEYCSEEPSRSGQEILYALLRAAGRIPDGTTWIEAEAFAARLRSWLADVEEREGDRARLLQAERDAHG